jgi:hypothetical protein
MRRALQVILAIAIGGAAFSGYLTARELAPAAPATSCPAIGEPGTILGYPPCVYGLVMYAAIVVVAAVGLARGRARTRGARPASPVGGGRATAA